MHLIGGFIKTQESFPLWFREIHVVNQPRVFHMFYNLLKPFLGEEVKKKIHFHNKYEELHEFLPKSILPHDFGGDLGPWNNDEAYQTICKMQPAFDEIMTFNMKKGKGGKK